MASTVTLTNVCQNLRESPGVLRHPMQNDIFSEKTVIFITFVTTRENYFRDVTHQNAIYTRSAL